MQLSRQRLRRAASFLTGHRVLDAGCNIADLVGFLPPEAMYVGLEVMPEVVELDRARFPGHEFIHCDIGEDWPAIVTRRRFDHVALLAVLEHLTAPESVLARARDVLAPRGTIVLTTPHPRAHTPHRLGAAIGLFSADASDEHEALYDRDGLETLARQAGLAVDHYETFQLGMNQLVVLKRSVA